MKVNILEFLDHADVKDSLYPGKRIVKPCKQIGEYKNHCVVIDWRDPSTIELNIRPGLSGKVLAPEVTKKYPVCFQMPTVVKINVLSKKKKKKDDEEEEEKGKSGGGGGKKPAKKKLDDIELIGSRFEKSVQGKIPKLGEIKEMMIMGKEIAKEAFGNAFAELAKQIAHAKITVTEILAKAADVVTKVAPPSFMEPSGEETASYNYDRDKNADIGFKMSLG